MQYFIYKSEPNIMESLYDRILDFWNLKSSMPSLVWGSIVTIAGVSYEHGLNILC